MPRPEQNQDSGIGGYFGLEVTRHDNFPQQEALLLNAGRHALAYILLHATVPPRKVYIPYYTCGTVGRTLAEHGIPCERYRINNAMLPEEMPELGEGEYFVQTNYFGLMDAQMAETAEHLGNAVITDNAQALYSPAVGQCYYSPAKWCGIPDGGCAYCEDTESYRLLPEDTSWENALHLLIRPDQGSAAGYAHYKQSHKTVDPKGVRKMSALTRHLISGIDFDAAKRKRNENFNMLHSELGGINTYPIPEGGYAAPMVYPLLVHNGVCLRQSLISQGIFVAMYWPTVHQSQQPGTLEHSFCENIVPLPVDQRYGEEDMQRIIDAIKRNAANIH